MIHSHIKKVAIALDEENFQVQLPDMYSHSNETFEDGEELDPNWLKLVWQRMFQIKMDAANISIPSGSQVLDACCGHGYLGEYISSLGGEVTFCDLSPLQLDALRARFADQNLPAEVIEADLLHLPFPDGKFDVVVGNSFLHHLPDVPKGLSELARVLKPGGRLVLFHEPSIRANYWETFPLSLIRDTTYNSGFTDLWQFEADRLASVLTDNGFKTPETVGSGVLSAILLNWYLIVINKLGIKQRFALEVALRLRALLLRLESPLKFLLRSDSFPSLFITAVRQK
jgi:ubiquinone/menaquinone biosynthesis C-methylase UbiE